MASNRWFQQDLPDRRGRVRGSVQSNGGPGSRSSEGEGSWTKYASCQLVVSVLWYLFVITLWGAMDAGIVTASTWLLEQESGLVSLV